LQDLTPTRLQLALGLSLAVWIGTAYVLFSQTQVLHVRYLETVTPAAAAALGIGAVMLATGRSLYHAALLVAGLAAVAGFALYMDHGTAPGRIAAVVAAVPAAVAVGVTVVLRSRPLATSVASGAAIVLTLIAALAVPFQVTAQLVRKRSSDAQTSGSMPPRWTESLNRYLHANRHGTRYELGSIAPAKAAPLIAADPQPVLMLTSYRGRPLISVAAVRAKVAAGEVRYFLIGRRCGGVAAGSASCVATARWVIAHGVDVTREAGVPRQGLLYRVDPGRL
jgi:hypothetical protein